MTSWPRRAAASLTLLALLVCALAFACWTHSTPRALVLPADSLPVILRADGFNAVEQFPDTHVSYRWSNGDGLLRLPNPGGVLIVRMTLAGGPGRAVDATIQAGSQAFEIPIAPAPRVYQFVLAPGSGERVSVRIVSPTVRSGQRDLGLVVGTVAIAGGGLPLGLIPGLWITAAGAYLLLQRAGVKRLFAWTSTFLLIAAISLWHAATGWHYATANALLLLVGGASFGALALDRWRPAHVDAPTPALRLARADTLVIAALLLVALAVRLPWIGAPDPVGDLELSARRMGLLHADGLAGAFRGDGDYMPLRLYWLWALSGLVPALGGSFAAPLPLATLALIKLPSLCADLATLALIYLTARRWRSMRGAALLAGLYALTPAVWINVAWWGQIDAALLLPLVAMLLVLDRRGGWSWALWAVALMIKPQAIVFAPILYAATLHLHGARGIARGGAIAGATLLAACAPLVLAGQEAGLAQSLLGAIGRFPKLTNNAYNLWYLVTVGLNTGGFDSGQGIGPLSYRTIGVLLIGGAAALVGAVLFLRSASLPTRAKAAAVLALAFFALPTQIHERYLFLCLVFFILAAAGDRRMLWPYLVLAVSAMLNIFGGLVAFWPAAYTAINATPLPAVLAWLNLLVLAGLCLHLVFGRLDTVSPALQPTKSRPA